MIATTASNGLAGVAAGTPFAVDQRVERWLRSHLTGSIATPKVVSHEIGHHHAAWSM